MKPLLALDIGGTKLATGIVSPEGKLVERQRRSTPTTDDAEVLFAAVEEMLNHYAPFDQFSVLGVGCGGPMALGGEHVSPLNIMAWRRFPLQSRLRQATGLACGIDNDAKALALAEGWVGAARGVSSFLAMVVSTGVGGGIVLNNRLLEGDGGNAGHVGHMIAASPGRHLPGHVQGVLEGEASGTAIAFHTGRPAQEATTSVVEEVGQYVGRVVASVANLLDLKLALVAGSVALGFGEPFFASAQAELDRICQLDFSVGARIEPAGCGDEGPLIGAAAVGLRSLGKPIGSIVG